MRNVLVTGGAGYIGSHACKILNEAGYQPVTIDNLSTGWRNSVKFGPLEVADLLDKDDLLRIFERYQPVAVMHFAGLSQVSESVQKPGLYWRNNVMGSLNLIEACVATGCDKFIFSSTCATYGEHDNVILTEETQQFPTNPYGSSKKAVEDLLVQFSEVTSLRYVIFRYFNVAGADPEGTIGEYHIPETHLIPKVFEALTDPNQSLTIFGTDYKTFDGTCVRDYIHVNDLVRAHILGLNWLEHNQVSRVYNLGSGEGCSVRQVIETCARVSNRRPKVIEGSRRPGDATKLVSGSTLAAKELNWYADNSELSKIVSDAWNWHQKRIYKDWCK